MLLQILCGRECQLLLFGRGDAGGCTTKPFASAHPDFNKYQTRAIAHDQVYFPKTRAVIACKQFEPLLLQIDGSALFGFSAL